MHIQSIIWCEVDFKGRKSSKEKTLSIKMRLGRVATTTSLLMVKYS